MINFISSHITDILLILVLVVVVIAIVRNHMKAKEGCGGGCSGCSASCHDHE